MYFAVLVAHSWVRWLVLVVSVLTFARSLSGVLQKRGWSPAERSMSIAFVAMIDIQVLLGLSLYFIFSPLVPKSLAELKAAMPVAPLRFFAIEHITMMVLALTVAHVSSVLARRAVEPRAKYKRLAWGAGLVLLLIFVAIPWPWSHVPRPLARF
jgi:hypothetical protein